MHILCWSECEWKAWGRGYWLTKLTYTVPILLCVLVICLFMCLPQWICLYELSLMWTLCVLLWFVFHLQECHYVLPVPHSSLCDWCTPGGVRLHSGGLPDWNTGSSHGTVHWNCQNWSTRDTFCSPGELLTNTWAAIPISGYPITSTKIRGIRRILTPRRVQPWYA